MLDDVNVNARTENCDGLFFYPLDDFLDREILSIRILTMQQSGGDPNLISDANS